jgi:hypothetical protein
MNSVSSAGTYRSCIMTHFSQAWASRQPELDRIFAETIRLVPMRASGYAAGGPDPGRIERQVPAIITETPQHMRAVKNSVGRDFDRMVVMAETVASIAQARLGRICRR